MSGGIYSLLSLLRNKTSYECIVQRCLSISAHVQSHRPQEDHATRAGGTSRRRERSCVCGLGVRGQRFHKERKELPVV